MLAKITALQTAANAAIASATATKAALNVANARIAELEGNLVEANARALSVEDEAALTSVTQALSDSATINSPTN